MNLHVYENAGNVKLVGKFNKAGSSTFDSFSWKLGDETIANLKGGNIFMHKSKSSESHFGGEIIDIRKEETEDNRAVVRFASCQRSVKAPEVWARNDWVTS